MLLSEAINILSNLEQDEIIPVIKHNHGSGYVYYTVGAFIADLYVVIDYCGDIQHGELTHISASKYLDMIALNNNK